MTLLTRDAILAADDLPTRDVDVPEWGGTVRVRTLTARERDEFEQNMIKRRGKSTEVNMQNLRARLVAASVVDDVGEPMFTQFDIKALGEKSAAALDRLFDASRELSGLSREDVDDLAGNLEEAQSDDSSSD